MILRVIGDFIFFGTIFVLLVTACTAVAEKPGPKTDHSFQPMTVNGKYQYKDSALAQVEDEKVLENLLKLRENFKDRIKKETKRQ